MDIIIMEKTAYLLVNFGGPRTLSEVEEFLIELLTDQEVIRTSLPAFLHRLLFTRVAKKRSRKVIPDYEAIGGGSPLFEDTEEIAKSVGEILGKDVITFHRYLPATHAAFLEKMKECEDAERICVFPLFPQFSYTTTGSIALWFKKHLPTKLQSKLQWVRSYPEHPSYIAVMQKCLSEFLQEAKLKEEETVILCSAHGLPKRYVATGDVYQKECVLSFDHLKRHFPSALFLLSYQSQFGKEEWIQPYTAEVCEQMCKWSKERNNVVVVPLSFTSDHIETLYEIEQLYLGSIRKNGLNAFRCPALNRRSDWIRAIVEIVSTMPKESNQRLLRSSI
jgi:protoporphyrin/coproporphyrin ferrochelatase